MILSIIILFMPSFLLAGIIMLTYFNNHKVVVISHIEKVNSSQLDSLSKLSE